MLNDPRDAYRENRVLTADPVALVRLLMEETLRSIAHARRHLAAGEIEARGRAVSKGMDLLTELMLNLNYDAVPEVARNLAALFEYARHRLFEAHAQQSDAGLAEAMRVLQPVLEAWIAVEQRGREVAETVQPHVAVPRNPYQQAEELDRPPSWI